MYIIESLLSISCNHQWRDGANRSKELAFLNFKRAAVFKKSFGLICVLLVKIIQNYIFEKVLLQCFSFILTLYHCSNPGWKIFMDCWNSLQGILLSSHFPVGVLNKCAFGPNLNLFNVILCCKLTISGPQFKKEVHYRNPFPILSQHWLSKYWKWTGKPTKYHCDWNILFIVCYRIQF